MHLQIRDNIVVLAAYGRDSIMVSVILLKALGLAIRLNKICHACNACDVIVFFYDSNFV